MIIDVLASGSTGNCYKLDDGNTSILLECGINLRDIYRKVDFNLTSIEGCLITHEHSDHAKSAHKIKAAGVPVYTSKGTQEILQLSDRRLHIISPDITFNIGSWRITPFKVLHDAKEPLGFVLQSQIMPIKISLRSQA